MAQAMTAVRWLDLIQACKPLPGRSLGLGYPDLQLLLRTEQKAKQHSLPGEQQSVQ